LISKQSGQRQDLTWKWHTALAHPNLMSHNAGPALIEFLQEVQKSDRLIGIHASAAPALIFAIALGLKDRSRFPRGRAPAPIGMGLA
jgi:hypothetical protein